MKQGKVNPGSDKAIKMGCTCPVLDNGHGNDELGRSRGFWITTNCPLHGPNAPREYEHRVTGAELAEALYDMDEDDQALFFNHLATLTKMDPLTFLMHLQLITSHKLLNPQGRRIMEAIVEYSHEALPSDNGLEGNKGHAAKLNPKQGKENNNE